MFLISRANSLPRRASLTAFWCLVVAHLEWPLMPSYLDSSYFLARRVYVDDGGGWPAAPLASQDSHVSQELREMPVALTHPKCPRSPFVASSVKARVGRVGGGVEVGVALRPDDGIDVGAAQGRDEGGRDSLS